MSDQLTPAAAGDAGRILLVDDEPTNLDILRETLAGPSYRLFVARSGEEALRVAARARPLIVLLDVVMPGIDGYETCRRLKADPETRDAAVIFVSALKDPKDRIRGFEAGAVDFISKPVQPEEVIARVNTHLAIQRLLHRQVEAEAPAVLGVAHEGEATHRPDDRRPGRLGPPSFVPVTSSPSASASCATWRKAAWASSTKRRISNCTSGSRSRPSCRTSRVTSVPSCGSSARCTWRDR